MDLSTLSPQEVTYLIKELMVAFREQVNAAGIMQMEPTLRVGKLTDTSTTLCTHDFSDPTTWYQRSKLYQSEMLTSQDNTHYRLAHFPVIHADSPKLYCRDMALLEKDGTYSHRDKYRMSVKINGEPVLESDVNHPWTMNYMTGELTFASRLSNDLTLTVDYAAHDENFPIKSLYTLKPLPGKCIIVEHVEIQFSQTVELNDTIAFELWAGSPDPAAYLNKGAFVNSPINPWRQTYRCAHDFINNCNEGKASIPAFGGNSWRGLPSDTLVFPFNYIQAFSIPSNILPELHVYLEKDMPYTNCGIATAAFYTLNTQCPGNQG